MGQRLTADNTVHKVSVRYARITTEIKCFS